LWDCVLKINVEKLNSVSLFDVVSVSRQSYTESQTIGTFVTIAFSDN